ncbi:transposase Tn3 family protein [Burkholderia lata]|uniref:Transposase Tn3 family protein n=1 Tax=Burkholderia lata (strain ATCC 17760 / DSM 23089 / LMG 22485 / NCIMB 9086 / R18194 / 383) TaxID=482957 RepID=A0A6P2RKD3_BURL3|nr:transposase Tn3 family protein [Burkholderia lata]
MQPDMRAFYDPAIFSKAAAVFSAASGDHRLDTANAQRRSMWLGVVTAIGVDHARPLQLVASQSANRRNRIDQRQQLRDVVDLRTGQDCGERGTAGISDNVTLGTGSRTIGRVWSSFWLAPTARIDNESTAARQKSIWSAARSFTSSSSCKWPHTPTVCQSRSRRQLFTPGPQPISAGRSRQRSPVLRTNKMPVSAARFETGKRPGFFTRLGLTGGSNGSISVHSSSLMIGLPISSAPVVPMPEANSSPRKLTAPYSSFETVS